ncbi:MAG: Tad domain-containing protein [Planctomycetes bacterium]|jgi:hypothetical protein|nr:Tad domain-containing protein [Planctomycetota bacterium]
MIQMLFAMFAFVFLGLAALVVDSGSARLTRLQMQNGVEAAAMEGLRQADAVSDLDRRLAAQEFMRWVYDDDFDPASGDEWQHGAGPLHELSGGVTGANALQTIRTPAPRVYIPDLQLNLENRIHGDMVAVRYLLDVLDHHEYSDYTRPDVWIPPTLEGLVDAMEEALAQLHVPPGIANVLAGRVALAVARLAEYEAQGGNLGTTLAALQSLRNFIEAQSGKFIPEPLATALIALLNQIIALLSEEPEGLPALLVRLRRTADPTDPSLVPPLDDQAGISSAGPALTYLLGRGSLIDNSRRRDGIVVRATAIAAARPATTVGRPLAGVRGSTPFVLEYDFWNSLGYGAVVLDADPAGNLTFGGATVGFCVARRAWSIGNDPSGAAVGLTAPGGGEVFVPIYDELDVTRIVGFGTVEATGLPDGIQMTRLFRSIAPVNASATVAPGLAGLPNNLLRAILGRNRALAEPLRAPVLVR